MSSYPTFFLFAVLVALAPGPDTFITLRVTVAGGRERGLWTVAGIIAANVVLGVLAATGLGAVIRDAHTLFDVLRWFGVLYLAWLGLQAVWAGLRGDGGGWSSGGSARMAPHAAMRQGFVSTFTNPKALAFYLAVLPQFVSAYAGFVELMAYALTLAVLGAIYLITITLVAHGAMTFISRERVRRGIDAGVGVIMLGFAAALALDN
ncbi:LysE family translocator [Nocardioides sp. BP30]|uniref:LysE family translocator n=1 Tax=Nocardioides sp. BP30 TaxID=3036374 RepID=UPI002469656B|nr:LysE family translocator [Nocardioides sp. BP30]WGL50470.1 LysE family translocator [Nocardioides sp. BP30]